MWAGCGWPPRRCGAFWLPTGLCCPKTHPHSTQIVVGDGTKVALRALAWSEGVEQAPVGLSGIEQDSDAVVVEVGDPERHALDELREVVGAYLEGLALWWSRAGVSCGRHVADGVGDAVVAPVTEVLGEVFSELVVVGFEPGDLVEGSLKPLSQRFG